MKALDNVGRLLFVAPLEASLTVPFVQFRLLTSKTRLQVLVTAVSVGKLQP